MLYARATPFLEGENFGSEAVGPNYLSVELDGELCQQPPECIEGAGEPGERCIGGRTYWVSNYKLRCAVAPLSVKKRILTVKVMNQSSAPLELDFRCTKGFYGLSVDDCNNKLTEDNQTAGESKGTVSVLVACNRWSSSGSTTTTTTSTTTTTTTTTIV